MARTRCTATLVSDRHLLSAAHCFDDDWDGQPNYAPDKSFTAAFDLPSGGVNIDFTAGDAVMLDGWVDAGADLTVITLPVDAPTDAPHYPLYGAQDEIGMPIVVAGYGYIGLGSTGETALLKEKLAGRNRYETTRNRMPSDEPLPAGGYLVYDFDSGREENDALALLGFDSDVGFGDDEVKSATGDSGAPVFIDGSIAGIVSFGVMGYAGDLLPEVMGTWGELAFDTRVSSFVDFVLEATDDMAVVLPRLEPGDAKHDYRFEQLDIVAVLAAGKYLTGQPARWSEGDWNDDSVFDQLDIVAALQTNNYVGGAYCTTDALRVTAVPEPSCFTLMQLAAIVLLAYVRRKRLASIRSSSNRPRR